MQFISNAEYLVIHGLIIERGIVDIVESQCQDTVGDGLERQTCGIIKPVRVTRFIPGLKIDLLP
jgi:hypothetical protein